MALSLVGNTGRGQIWVGLSSVMSKEAPIPPAPSCEAAQPNHGHPNDHFLLLHILGKREKVPPNDIYGIGDRGKRICAEMRDLLGVPPLSW